MLKCKISILVGYPGHFRQAGNFLGGVTSQVAIQAGRGLQNVADYCGPWDSKLVIERAEDDLTDAEKTFLILSSVKT